MSAFTYWSPFHGYFVEIEDPDNPGQTKRPDPGYQVLTRDPNTLTELEPILTGNFGHWSPVTFEGHPILQVSSDDGATWVTLVSIEASVASATSGVDATTALTNSNDAVATANQALEIAQSGSGGTTGPIQWSQIQGTPAIPDDPGDIGALPASARGTQGGVAALDGSSKVPVAQLPTGSSANQVAVGNHTHPQSPDSAAPGSIINHNESAVNVYPTRPTTRTDVLVRFKGHALPGPGNGDPLPGDEVLLIG